MNKPYPKYKSSGIDWIGEIPAHWELNRTRYLGKLHTGSTPSSGNPNFWEGNIIWITPEDLSSPGILYLHDSKRKITELGLKDIGGELVPPCTIIISTRAPIGNIAIAQTNLSFNQGCKGIEVDTEKYHCEFIYYFLINAKSQLQALGKGTTFTELSSQSLKDLLVNCPPLVEQTTIANFLDEKIAAIGKLIANKQKLIKLLKEERTAIINEAVSGKGKNWERKKLKYVADVNSSKRNFVFEKKSDAEVVFLPMEKVSENGMINQEARKKVSEVSTGFTYFERGDVIVAKITPCFENGKGSLLENLETDFGFGSTEFHTLRASDKITREFLFFQAKTDRFMQIGEAFMTGSAGQKRVPTSFVQNFEIELPPLKEQTTIVQHIQTETQRIDNTVSKIEKEIELMNEYRTSLISEVVTGKIKVT